MRTRGPGSYLELSGTWLGAALPAYAPAQCSAIVPNSAAEWACSFSMI